MLFKLSVTVTEKRERTDQVNKSTVIVSVTEKYKMIETETEKLDKLRQLKIPTIQVGKQSQRLHIRSSWSINISAFTRDTHCLH